MSRSPNVAAIDRRVRRLAARSWDIATTSELASCGMSKDAIPSRIRRGHLRRMHRGVFLVGGGTPRPESRVMAAVRACGAIARASHWVATWLWELSGWRGGLIDVTVAGDSTRTHSGVRVHRALALDPADCAEVKGIPVTSPARTLIDFAAQASARSLRASLREALGRELVTVRTLIRAMERGGPRPGNGALRELLATGAHPTRSELEDIVLDLVLAGGFERPDVNKPIHIDGRKVIPDLRWPRQQLIIEADGRRWHDNPIARAEDVERQAFLEARGERVIRVTWMQAVGEPEQTRARIGDAGAPKR